MQNSINNQLGQGTHTRFRVEGIASVKLSNSKVGIITEIDKEGLVFRYIQEDSEEKTHTNEPLTVSIYKNGFSLLNLPCRILKDNDILPEYYLSSAKMQKCHIQFEELTADQKSQLDYFISHFTTFHNKT
jgi:predicted nucleic acid-binding OB-fold protein